MVRVPRVIDAILDSSHPLLTHVARKGRPIILSTGMNDLESVRVSVAAIRETGCPFMLMHCTSAYLTAYEHVRLGAMQQLRDEFDVPVGLSDHSLGIYAGLGAVALGASAVEKHFTISREWPGPDNPISIEPDELAELIKGPTRCTRREGARRLSCRSRGRSSISPTRASSRLPA